MKYYLNILLTSIYLWIRPTLKWILRRTTRLCEFQRICYDKTKGASRTIQVEYSIEQCRTAELKKVFNDLSQKAKDSTLNDHAIYYAVYSVVRVKNINIKIHRRFPAMLAESFTKIWGYQQLSFELENLRATKYDSENPIHERKLMNLWSQLQPDVPLICRVSKQWQDIGFQGDDPQTDFRGMGMLSLENLLFFAQSYPSAAQHVLLRSQHPVFGYSFAIVSINITHMAYTLVKDGDAKTHFYNACKGFLDTDDFHKFYCYLIFEFDQMWRREKPKDIMEFSRVRTKFEHYIKSKLKDPQTMFTCQFVLENI